MALNFAVINYKEDVFVVKSSKITNSTYPLSLFWVEERGQRKREMKYMRKGKGDKDSFGSLQMNHKTMSGSQ